MGLSRLQNFIKNAKGNILYVSPNDLDATDSIENQGNSLTRPFKTIQRALIEASRFSYQAGLDNDRFEKTTVLVYPGEHTVDNRPGWIPYDDGSATAKYRDRNGTSGLILSPYDLTSNFDLSTSGNDLYKLNSIYGGVIIPRGVSLVGMDVRKTRIRPKYVPNPENNNIARSSIFKVTGGAYFTQFSLFDADPNGNCYKDYTTNIFVPNFSHHKLTCFEFCDGVNAVDINDTFMTFSSSKTDLDMYYDKISDVYDHASGRAISPDYPAGGVDIQPKVDEYRIVGSLGAAVGISSIKAGDGVTASTTITVQTSSSIKTAGIDVDTPIRITGVTASGYDGDFVCAGVTSTTEFTYTVSNAPTTALENPSNATCNVVVNTVTSSSPYIFNCSLRSVYGMCGLDADGKKATGFKSMVAAQFTGIGLQKDNNAFIKYNEVTGAYDDSTTITNLSSNSRAVYKPGYSNFHIKASNDAVLQVVSIFAIGYAQHFVAESGGDQSITNSNSNFGAKAFLSKGFKADAFSRDDIGYVTHIIPPKEIETTETSVEFNSLDVTNVVGVGSTSRLYLYNQNNQATKPPSVLEGYRFGAKVNDELKVIINADGVPTTYKSRVTMPSNGITTTQYSSVKTSEVGQAVGFNSISSNTVTFTAPHNFINGETIRILSDTGNLPDGLDANKVYFAITSENTNASGVSTDQIQVAVSLNDASDATAVGISSLGGRLTVESRVSDKISGDIGHPVQWDSSQSQWYVNVSAAATDNELYSTIVGLGTTSLGLSSPRGFITRRQDNRALADTIYRMRYVIPAGSGIASARPPVEGFVVQESNDTGGATSSEVAALYSPTAATIANITELRNPRYISTCTYTSGIATVDCEIPHELTVGSEVKLVNITSGNNTAGTAATGFNRDYIVSGINSARSFTVGLSTDPGVFTNSTSTRTTTLPRFQRKSLAKNFNIYQSEEVIPYQAGKADGVYNLTVKGVSNAPEISYFTDMKFSQPVADLYPQLDRDNPNSNPTATRTYAIREVIGEVVVNNQKDSLTRQSVTDGLNQIGLGVGITDIQSNSTGTAHTIFTKIDHGLNRVTQVSIGSSGANYGVGSGSTEQYYGVNLIGFAGSTTGKHANVRVTVHPTGGIVDVKIIDGGSAYAIGNTMTLSGLPKLASPTDASISVTQISNGVGAGIEVQGVTSTTGYNNLYKVTEVQTGEDKRLIVSSASTVGSAHTVGIGTEPVEFATATKTYPTIGISTFTFDQESGIATITTVGTHGLAVDNNVRIGNALHDQWNGDAIVKKIVGLSTFTAQVGIATTTAGISSATIYHQVFNAQGGVVNKEDENLSGRQVLEYAGITTTLSAEINSASTANVSITSVENFDLHLGDFLLVDEELVRIKSSPGTSNVSGASGAATNPLSVLRGVLGTRATTHVVGSIIRRVKVNAVELRRQSILRASGHTFEYIGQGPGNYSTSLPSRIDRKLTPKEELLAQSTNCDGGLNVYTAMNNDGDYFVGNKVINSRSGKEEIFDTPVPTVTGEAVQDAGASFGQELITSNEATISRSLRVEGGPDGNIVSEFDGPVLFNDKITSTASGGIEADSLYLQGGQTVSRNVTVGIATPTVSGNPGDLKIHGNPVKGGYAGWVYTTDNDWYRWGNVSASSTERVALFDRVGIATTTPGGCELVIGTGVTEYLPGFQAIGRAPKIVSCGSSLGIGTANPQYDLHVEKNVWATGFVTAGTYVYGDGRYLTNLNTDSNWTENEVGSGANLGMHTGGTVNGIGLDVFVGVGTTAPGALLSVGVGTTATAKPFVIQDASGTELIGVTTIGRLGISSSTPQGVLDVNGQFISNQYALAGVGTINAGLITATTALHAGVGGTVFQATTSAVGIGTSTQRSLLDVDGRLRTKSHHESVGVVTSVSGVVSLDLAQANSFTVTIQEAISQFTLLNPPDDASSFTVAVSQDATGGYAVGIDTFKDSGGSAIPVYWSGSVVPIVTTTASKTDIYSFITFDGGSTLYGVPAGQNFG